MLFVPPSRITAVAGIPRSHRRVCTAVDTVPGTVLGAASVDNRDMGQHQSQVAEVVPVDAVVCQRLRWPVVQQQGECMGQPY